MLEETKPQKTIVNYNWMVDADDKLVNIRQNKLGKEGLLIRAIMFGIIDKIAVNDNY